jgi:fructose-bisphosphate aldolase, class II
MNEKILALPLDVINYFILNEVEAAQILGKEDKTMALVTTTEMFKKAYHGGYAVGAFNVNNMEIVQGITEAAGELKSPVILQVSKGARAYANHTYLVKLVEAAVIENPEIPIALHLDHGAY